MKVKTFPGGIHPPDLKEATNKKPIEDAPVPALIVLPLQQSAGAACEPLVGPGDAVLVGQKIADSDKPISAPIHSPVSGIVKAIAPRPHHSGLRLLSIVIEPDMKQTPVAQPDIETDPSPERMRQLVREAGIVGLGGAAFPTQIKLAPPGETKIDSVIINGCECEPYLTVDHRLMVEEPAAILDGLSLIMRTVGAERGFIAVETNKPDALDILFEATKDVENIQVIPVETKYPQGSEKQLIRSVLDREVPSKGLPSAVGALVQNVATAIAVSRAIRACEPLTKKVVTVSGGGIVEPKNLRVFIGTAVGEVISLCGGIVEGGAKVIYGGPLMGVSLSSLDVPVVKATSGIIALMRDEVDTRETRECIKCARCVEACPMGLMPNLLGNLVEFGIWDEAEGADIFDCLECGACAYVCPSRRQLVQSIKVGKFKLTQDRAGQKR